MKKSLVPWLLGFSLLFLFSNCNKEELVINNTDDFETYLQEEMEDQNIPALSVLIFKEDQMLYENYLGKTHIQQDIPLQSDHLFLLASVSKVVTATALLQLHEKGHFSLEDNINDHLPFEVHIPGYSEAISFRMLLTHTAAIADGAALDDQYYYGTDSPVGLNNFLENYLVLGGNFYDSADNFYDFEPGTEYEYSNIGNALIGLLVQEISGLDFDDFCKQNIFQPLGMNHSSWRLDEISQPIVQPYDYTNGEYEAIGHYTFTDYPNGGLRSTSRDLFTFLSAFVQGGSANNFQVLEAATIEAMITPQIPSLDAEVGLHLFLLNADNNLWGHDGGEQGVATIMAFNPSTKTGAIILCNQGEADLDQMLVAAYQLGLGL